MVYAVSALGQLGIHLFCVSHFLCSGSKWMLAQTSGRAEERLLTSPNCSTLYPDVFRMRCCNSAVPRLLQPDCHPIASWRPFVFDPYVQWFFPLAKQTCHPADARPSRECYEAHYEFLLASTLRTRLGPDSKFQTAELARGCRLRICGVMAERSQLPSRALVCILAPANIR